MLERLLPRWNTPKRAPSRVLRRVVRVTAYAYLLTLLAVCAAFTAIGERHWLTAGLLYVPRALFAAPIVLLGALVTGSSNCCDKAGRCC